MLNNLKNVFKNSLRVALALFTLISILVVSSCGGIEYDMVECNAGNFKYSIPDYYVLYEHSEADAYYVTVNSEIAVYSYTRDEFDAVFPDYVGDYSAVDVAEYIIERNNYQCQVKYEGSRDSATYNLLYHTESGAQYYYMNSLLSNESNIAMLSFSCPVDRADGYDALIRSIVDSMGFKDDFIIE